LAATAALGAGKLARTLPFSQLHAAENDVGDMPVRALGKTGHKVKLFSLGGQSTIEQGGTEKESVEIINKALDLGVNYIDTAAAYGRGNSETYIGKVMKHRRDEVFLATKTGSRNYDGAMRECEQSLKRLQTDHIDLYQHHNVSQDARLNQIMEEDGALKAFRKLKDEGVVSYLGITGHSSRILLDALNRYDYDCTLVTLNPAGLSMSDRGSLEDFFAAATKKNVGVIAMKLIGRGRLLEKGIDMKQAFNYALSFPVSTAIIGITEVGQVSENVNIACNFQPMSSEQLEQLEKDA